jgi:hypothetical protein
MVSKKVNFMAREYALDGAVDVAMDHRIVDIYEETMAALEDTDTYPVAYAMVNIKDESLSSAKVAKSNARIISNFPAGYNAVGAVLLTFLRVILRKFASVTGCYVGIDMLSERNASILEAMRMVGAEESMFEGDYVRYDIHTTGQVIEMTAKLA